MEIKFLKDMMFLPDEEVIINKTILINDLKVHLLCMTTSNDVNTLWAMYENTQVSKNEIDTIVDFSQQTNRDLMTRSVEKTSNSYFPIRQLTVQGQDFIVSSSSSRQVNLQDIECMMKLQHFAGLGLIPSFLNKSDTGNVCISSYSQKEDEEPLKIDLAKDLNMTLQLGRNQQRALINAPLEIGFKELKNEAHSFYNSITEKQVQYYLQPLELYDIWTDLETKFSGDVYKDFTEDQKIEMSDRMSKAIENICPKDKKLVVLKYEIEDNISLNFYTKDHLDLRHESNSSATGIILSSDEKIGSHGFRHRMCQLGAVDRDFCEDMVLELFSFNLTGPEVVITIEN